MNIEESQDIEKMTIEPKDVLIVRMNDQYTVAEVTQMINEIAEQVNANDKKFKTPVLFLDESMKLEKISINDLETLLDHAKAIQESGEDAQEEVAFDNPAKNPHPDDEKTKIDPEELPDELKALVPDNVKNTD